MKKTHLHGLQTVTSTMEVPFSSTKMVALPQNATQMTGCASARIEGGGKLHVAPSIFKNAKFEIVLLMRQVLLERDMNIAVNGCSWFKTSTKKGPFTAMLISRSRGTYLIK